jgi:hypothetical protein
MKLTRLRVVIATIVARSRARRYSRPYRPHLHNRMALSMSMLGMSTFCETSISAWQRKLRRQSVA